jgi:hypothetical protein
MSFFMAPAFKKTADLLGPAYNGTSAAAQGCAAWARHLALSLNGSPP